MNKNVLKFMVFIMLLNIITPLFNKMKHLQHEIFHQRMLQI